MILWGAFLVFLTFMVLRLIFNYADPNPFGKVGRLGFKIRKLTEKWVYPAARFLANFRVDTRLAPLVTLFIGLVFTYFASQIIGNTFFVVDGISIGIASGNPKMFIGFVLYVYQKDIPRVCDESDEPDNAASPETHSADRHVRPFGDDRTYRNRPASVGRS
jgi:hypothetical protein